MAEDCIAIAEVEGLNPIPPWIFSGFLFTTAVVALIYNCNDLLSFSSSSGSSYIWFSHIHYSVSKVTVKRATETCNFSAASYVAHFTTTFKPVLPQIRLLQVVRVLTSDWLKLPWSHAIHGTSITCCKTKLRATVNRGRYRIFSKRRL